ncbi:metal-dependent hydrolase [Wenyingzhuangia sp. IMCC45574]
MDIISHTLTGTAVGTVLATISNQSWKRKTAIILMGSLGGALPDFDALSLWSKFDTTIGSMLSLKHSGREIYFGKFWYSHHAALHSIIAPILLILIATVITAIFKKEFGINNVWKNLRVNKYYLSAFFFGFLFHLLEDMPTPASVWGGVNLFYPSSNYIGGFGKIWWWNNYDLVLIICTVILLNLLVNIISKKRYLIKLCTSVTIFLIGFGLFLFQINTRPFDFSYEGHKVDYHKFESKSMQIQKDILGEQLYNIMTKIDNKIPLNF